ncbi:hypothetical protein [Ursidibacter arcticus]
MVKDISHIIISSISMAFLVMLSWSIAYAYGWGQSCFYGYPIWYVDISTSNIARSIGYVLSVTFILLVISLVSLWIICKLKPFISERFLIILLSFILGAILWFPILIISVITISRLDIIVIFIHLSLAIISAKLLIPNVSNKIQGFNRKEIFIFLKKRQHYIIIYTYVYFVLAAFIVGCLKPYFTNKFDMLEVNHKMYYVIAKYDDSIVLSENIKKDKENFYIYRISLKSLMHLKVNQPIGLQQSCNVTLIMLSSGIILSFRGLSNYQFNYFKERK